MFRRLALLGPLLCSWGCGEELEIRSLRWPLSAFCTVNVVGKGSKEVETDYLPHVITCENGAADDEALRAQAVAARTFLYYKLATSGSVLDGTKDQVYSCASQPAQRHYDAVNATSGQVIVWSDVVICSFFVAGAKPTTADCVAAAGDPDDTTTEKFVTYNEGKSGAAVTQSTLGWVSPTNKFNRGCFSQNGSHCQSLKGRRYPEILRFYYGADIQIQTAPGACVTPADLPTLPVDSQLAPPDAAAVPDAGGPLLDQGLALDWTVVPREAGGQALALQGGCSAAPGGSAASIPWVLCLALLALLGRRRFSLPRRPR